MNLCFALLDEPIIHGRGEEPAWGDLTFAQLLAEVAAVGGVLRAVEVAADSPVSVSIQDDHRWCVAALAVARVGGWVVRGSTAVGFREDATLHWADSELGWQAVLKAGRTDPAPAIELAPTASYDGSRPLGDLVEHVSTLSFPASAAAIRAVLS